MPAREKNPQIPEAVAAKMAYPKNNDVNIP